MARMAGTEKDGDRPTGLSRSSGLPVSRPGALLVRSLAQRHRQRRDGRAADPLLYPAHGGMEKSHRLATARGALDDVLSAQGRDSQRTRALARRGFGLFRRVELRTWLGDLYNTAAGGKHRSAWTERADFAPVGDRSRSVAVRDIAADRPRGKRT